MVHELKIRETYFLDILKREKTFEVRKNDRGFKVRDKLRLRVYENDAYTGDELVCEIGYIIENIDGLMPGYCVLGINVFGVLL